MANYWVKYRPPVKNGKPTEVWTLAWPNVRYADGRTMLTDLTAKSRILSRLYHVFTTFSAWPEDVHKLANTVRFVEDVSAATAQPDRGVHEAAGRPPLGTGRTP